MTTHEPLDMDPLEALMHASPEAIPVTTFVVRADGTVRGDDMAGGDRAAALPYLGRLALNVGQFLGAGEPVAIEVLARTRMSVQVSWTPALEGTFRAVIHHVAQRPAPNFTVVGGVGVDAAAAHCVQRLVAFPALDWCALLASDTRVVAAAGHDEKEAHHLAEIGTRMLAVLRAVEASSGRTFVRIDFDGVSMVAATIGRHCLFARGTRMEEDAIGPLIDEVRAILDGHDLATATTAEGFANLVDRGPAPTAPNPAAPAASATPAATLPPVGARFRGAAAPRERQKRKWGRGS